MTFAKGLGNGLAIGGVVGRPELVDSVRANSVSTFGGNPLSSAGALANLDYIISHDLQANALQVGNFLRDRLQVRTGALGVVGEIRGKGLMVGIELVEPGTLTANPQAAQAVLEACRRGGLLVGKGGLYNNVLRIAPPMSVTMSEATSAVEVLTEVLYDVDQAAQGRKTEIRSFA
jgi:4-aminobutyrate aminotransferase